MTDKAKIADLQEDVKRLETLNSMAGSQLMNIINTRFVSRRKIRKMYKTNDFDIIRTVQLYFNK